MSELHEQVITFSENFCDICFSYLMNKKDTDSEKLDTKKCLEENLIKMVNIIHNAGKNKTTYINVYVVQGVRFSIVKIVGQKTLREETLSDGIVTENEIRKLFDIFEEHYEKNGELYIEDLKAIFHRMFKEINYLCSEYDGIALQSYNLTSKMIEKKHMDHLDTLDSSLKKMKKDIGGLTTNINDLETSFLENVDKTSEKISTARRNLLKATNESKSLLNNTISILGLFMTIAAAVFGGVTITNEVLKAISGDMFTSTIFVLATSFILVNLIFLFSFIIAKMSGKDIGMQCQHFSISLKSLKDRYKINIDDSFIEENLYELHNCLFCDSKCGFFKKFKCRYQYMLYVDAILIVLFVVLGIIWIIKEFFYASWVSSLGDIQVKNRLFKTGFFVVISISVIILSKIVQKKANIIKIVITLVCSALVIIGIVFIILAGYQFYCLIK